MDLTLFFAGGISREEMASAFLATLLCQHCEFRTFFLSLMQCDVPTCVAQQKWEVKVEKDGVDVWMAADAGPVVIIENKLFPGAVQARQLLRYYEKEIKINPHRPVSAVYLAPGETTGSTEVERVLVSERFREGDRAIRVSWEEVTNFQPAADDPHKLFITSGLENVRNAINSTVDEKYPLVGDRKTIYEIMQQARGILASEFGKVRLRPWRARANQVLYTVGTRVTVYLRLGFKVQETEPYEPVGVRQLDGRLAVTLCTDIHLSAIGKKDPALRVKWQEFLSAKRIDVPELGPLELDGDRWFVRSETLVGERETLVARLVAAGKALFATLQGYL